MDGFFSHILASLKILDMPLKDSLHDQKVALE